MSNPESSPSLSSTLEPGVYRCLHCKETYTLGVSLNSGRVCSGHPLNMATDFIRIGEAPAARRGLLDQTIRDFRGLVPNGPLFNDGSEASED